MFEHGSFVLGMDRPLIIFTDPEVEERLREVRGNRPTLIIPIALEELLSEALVNAAERGARQLNANAAKVTPPYIQLMWAKYAMLYRALKTSPTPYVGWIDLAIQHVAKFPPQGVDVFAYPTERPRVHALRCFTKAEVEAPDYWHHVRGDLAGGLVVGGWRSMVKLVVAFFEALDLAVSRGLAPLDEGLLSYVVGQQPERFTYSYGDYEDILRNHDVPRDGAKHRAWIRADAQQRGLPGVMGDAARYVYDPARGSVPVVGSPAVILGYRAETTPHIVPGRYERSLVEWAKELAPPSKQFVDCGAHMGSWTLVMAQHFREVHAFEPQRLIFQQLCGNIALNGLTNVFAYPIGLDAEAGPCVLHQPGVDRGSSSARDDVAARFLAQGVALDSEGIDVVPLDTYLTELCDVGLVKIDVEGLERRVLQGAQRVLRLNGLPKLILECWSDVWNTSEKTELLAWLDSFGYRIVPISGYADMLLAEKR
jgi:FkbM family methyltransferase